MPWRYDRWSVEHALPVGVNEHVAMGQEVRAGDVIAGGSVFGSPLRVAVARRVGVDEADLARVMRVPIGAEVQRGALIARTGSRFARSATAPIDGRLIALRADGDVEMAPIVGRWTVRSTIDGTVVTVDEARILVAGEAWCLQGLAAYGPDAVGELAKACETGADELLPGRIDTRLRGRILIGGGRAGPEAIARAHACGVAGVVAGASPASGLRHVYGEDVTAHGLDAADLPTVLCLAAFGTTTLPDEVYAPLVALAGHRAAIHSASARLFVFAASDAFATAVNAPSLALAADWSGVRPVTAASAGGQTHRFSSEVDADAMDADGELVPAANVRRHDLPSD